MASSWTKARSALAGAIQRGDPPETITALRRDYTAARAEHYLTGLVQCDPPLTDTQLVRLAAILTSARPRHYGAT
jgi:hypothetical protein